MKLTDQACGNAKPQDKEYKMPDGGGLYLVEGAYKLSVDTCLEGPGDNMVFRMYSGADYRL